MTRNTLITTIRQIIYDAGLRSPVTSSPSPLPQSESVGRATTTTSSAKRKEVMQIHGLRKFYDTATTQAGVHPLYVEMPIYMTYRSVTRTIHLLTCNGKMEGELLLSYLLCTI